MSSDASSSASGAAAPAPSGGSSKLDQSLGSIISDSRPPRKQRGGNNNGGTGPIRHQRGNNRAQPYVPPYNNNTPIMPFPMLPPTMPAPAANTAPSQRIVGDTVYVSNLDKDVTDDDLADIFRTDASVSNIVRCAVHYGANGQSLGTGIVTFRGRRDADKAVSEFDGAEVDGRIMHVKLIGTVANAPLVKKAAQAPVTSPMPLPMMPMYMAPQVLSNRAPQQPLVQQRQNNRGQNPRNNNNNNNNNAGGSASTDGGRGRRNVKKPATQEDLDADLDSYINQGKSTTNTTETTA